MVRTIVYDSPEIRTEYAEAARVQGASAFNLKAHRTVQNQIRQRADERQAAGGASRPARKADDLQTKLVKYVPAEVVTVSAGGFAAFNPAGNWIWFGLALGAVANVLYLFVAAFQSTEKVALPRWYFYVLSVAAFVVWAIATISPIQGVMHLTAEKASFILVAGAFGIPLLDSFFGVVDLLARGSKYKAARAES